MKVVFFEGSTWLTSSAKEVGIRTIEEKVNDFLCRHPDIKIHHIKQSSTSTGDGEGFESVVCISIWFTNNSDVNV